MSRVEINCFHATRDDVLVGIERLRGLLAKPDRTVVSARIVDYEGLDLPRVVQIFTETNNAFTMVAEIPVIEGWPLRGWPMPTAEMTSDDMVSTLDSMENAVRNASPRVMEEEDLEPLIAAMLVRLETVLRIEMGDLFDQRADGNGTLGVEFGFRGPDGRPWLRTIDAGNGDVAEVEISVRAMSWLRETCPVPMGLEPGCGAANWSMSYAGDANRGWTRLVGDETMSVDAVETLRLMRELETHTPC